VLRQGNSGFSCPSQAFPNGGDGLRQGRGARLRGGVVGRQQSEVARLAYCCPDSDTCGRDRICGSLRYQQGLQLLAIERHHDSTEYDVEEG
jgi:hypothetical protein